MYIKTFISINNLIELFNAMIQYSTNVKINGVIEIYIFIHNRIVFFKHINHSKTSYSTIPSNYHD